MQRSGRVEQKRTPGDQIAAALPTSRTPRRKLQPHLRINRPKPQPFINPPRLRHRMQRHPLTPMLARIRNQHLHQPRRNPPPPMRRHRIHIQNMPPHPTKIIPRRRIPVKHQPRNPNNLLPIERNRRHMLPIRQILLKIPPQRLHQPLPIRRHPINQRQKLHPQLNKRNIFARGKPIRKHPLILLHDRTIRKEISPRECHAPPTTFRHFP